MEILIYQHNSNLSFDDYQLALTGLISESCPNLIVDFQPVDLALAEFLEGWLSKGLTELLLSNENTKDPFSHFWRLVGGGYILPQKKRLLVDIGKTTTVDINTLTTYAKVSHAGWGFCSDAFLAFNYAPPECRIRNLVHESLHLFSVNDCYDENTGKPVSSCDNPKCIMRYGQSAVSIEICSSVKFQLKDYEALYE
jgi:hypothetical protein